MDRSDDQGWVRPVADADTTYMDPIEPTGRTIRSSVFGGIVLVAVIAAAIAGTIMWRNRNGDPFASARSVPAGMDIVVTFDALALSDSERLQSFVDAFAVPMVEAGVIDDYPDDLVLAIDEAMADESGFTLSDDILPWVGRSVSIAASVPELDLVTMEADQLAVLLSADVRNRGAAEAFVDKVIGELAVHDLEVAATSIGGLPGYSWDDPDEDLIIGLVLTDDTLLVGTEPDVADAIAAREAGLSIAEEAVFKDAVGRLPDERMVSFYMASSAVEAFTDIAAMGMPVENSNIDEELFTATAAAVSLVDEGMLFSYVMIGAEESAGAIVPDETVLRSLPEDTLGFFSIAATASQQPIDEQAISEMRASLDQLSFVFGLDVAEVIESLSGDITVAATETRTGSIAAETDVPVGVVGALGLADPGPVNEMIEMLEAMLMQQGASVDASGGITTISGDGQELISYAAGDDLVVIGTSADLVGHIATGAGGGLLNSDLYRELDGAVIGDGLVLYADVTRIVNLVPMTTDEVAVFGPLRGVGFGGAVSGDALEMELMLLVDY